MSSRLVAVDITVAGRVHLPGLIAGLLVKEFDGDSTKTFLQIGDDVTRLEPVQAYEGTNCTPAATIYVVVTEGQPGKTLKISCSDETIKSVPGLLLHQLADSAGVPINPSTEGSLDELEAELGNLPVLQHGRATVGVAAAAIVASSTPIRSGFSVTLKAMPTNAGVVYIGGSQVTTVNGFPLSTGESLTLCLADVTAIYGIASLASQGLAWILEAVS